MIRHLSKADYRVMPWANGRGQTTELIRVEGPEGMLWRLSVASVVEDGAFSIFPGIERNLTVLSGPGFDLAGPGLRLRADPLVPVAFAGDVVLGAEGVTAPVTDFNVMTARRLPKPEVWVAGPGRILPGSGRAAAGETGQTLCLFAPAAGGGLAAHDLLIADRPVDLAVRAIAVRLAVPFPEV